jgi:hypothetical protein
MLQVERFCLKFYVYVLSLVLEGSRKSKYGPSDYLQEATTFVKTRWVIKIFDWSIGQGQLVDQLG